MELAINFSNPVFIKGLVSFGVMFAVFVGSIYLLVTMILGAKLGYFVTASCWFGVLVLISSIWFVTGLGPKGPFGFIGNLGIETGWEPVAAGPHLSQVESEYGKFDFSSYPNGWTKPSEKGKLADLSGEDSTATELANVKPVLDTLILGATSPIPGKRKEVAHQIKGPIGLNPDGFKTTDVLMKQAKVEGKDSIVAVGRAVASDKLNAGPMGGAEEGRVSRNLAELGTEVNPGDPIMQVKTAKGSVQLTADKKGRLIDYGFKIGDKIKPNVAFATVDITGQAGAAEPVMVAAARIRGSVRVPAFIYLSVSLGLLILHLGALSRIERRQKAATAPQTQSEPIAA